MGKSAIIIGSGYGGLALANLLAKKGYRVTVLEKNSSLGGRIATYRTKGYTFDLGPSWYLMPEIFERYYTLFDISARDELDLVKLSPAYKVFFEYAEPITINGNVNKDAAVFNSLEAGAGKALQRYIQTSSKAYKAALRYFLYNSYYKMSDILNPAALFKSVAIVTLAASNLHTYVSRRFKDLRLKQILEYQMVFLGSSPFSAPAIYTLMSHLDFKSGVYYPRRGFAYLAESLKLIGLNLGVTYRTNAEVTRILTSKGEAIGVSLSSGETVTADIVVSNADLHFTETKLLQAKHQTYPEEYWSRREPGPSALIISLGISKKLPNLQHHNLYFVKNWRENFTDIYTNKQIPKNASMYVCNPSKSDPKLAPDGKENIFILVPLPAGLKLTKVHQKSIANRFICTLGDMVGESDLQKFVEVMHVLGPDYFGESFNAWQGNAFGGESHILSQSVFNRTANKSKKIKNFYYVGAGTLPGIGLPMCLISAQLTFKRILGISHNKPLEKSDLE